MNTTKTKPIIKIHFQNGLNLDGFIKDVFNIYGLPDEFEFIESDAPDFIVFGPYGNNIPPKGNYTRIGYYCENMMPDMSICDWAFGVMREDEVNHPCYKKIQWHGFNPQSLIKNTDFNGDELLAQKKHFCNFLYSHHVPYREEFFRQLSRYKKVDAPGLSMNNMPGIDSLYQGDIWSRKRQFLSSYKFTIAFENYVYPGYQTEKLFDAMLASSIPVYCGDPYINETFNTASFLNTPDYVNINKGATINWLEKNSQPNFVDIRPASHNSLKHQIKRKLKTLGRKLKMQKQFGSVNFKPLIDQIVELDENDDKYLEVLNQPWLINNSLPSTLPVKNFWLKIFKQKHD